MEHSNAMSTLNTQEFYSTSYESIRKQLFQYLEAALAAYNIEQNKHSIANPVSDSVSIEPPVEYLKYRITNIHKYEQSISILAERLAKTFLRRQNCPQLQDQISATVLKYFAYMEEQGVLTLNWRDGSMTVSAYCAQSY